MNKSENDCTFCMNYRYKKGVSCCFLEHDVEDWYSDNVSFDSPEFENSYGTLRKTQSGFYIDCPDFQKGIYGRVAKK